MSTAKNSTRNLQIDCLKGILILLVVFAHNIQYGAGQQALDVGLWKENVLFLLMYAFHMPLFMAVSAWVMGMKPLGEGDLFSKIKRRALQILLPAFVVTFMIEAYISWRGGDVPFRFGMSFVNRFDFLSALFVLTVVIYLIEGLKKGKWIGYVVAMIVFMATPAMVGRFATQFINFLGPFFLSAFLLSKYKTVWLSMYLKYQWWLIGGCALLFAWLFQYFHFENLMYFNELAFWRTDNVNLALEVLQKNMFRYLMGALASIVVGGGLHAVYSWLVAGRWVEKALVYVGRNSLGLYIYSGVITGQLLFHFPETTLPYTLTVQLLETFAITVICLVLITLLRQNKWTAFLFLGVLPRR